MAHDSVGRPRMHSDEDLKVIAKEFIEWARKPDSIHVAQFCRLKDIYTEMLYDWRDRSPEFSCAFKYAKDCMAMNIREKPTDGAYLERMKMRDITACDVFLKREERADMEHASKLKQKELAVQAETLDKLNAHAKAGLLSQK
jgi:hypothetical protein